MPPSYRQFEAITVQGTPVYTCMAVPTFFWEVYRYSGGGLSQKYIIHVHLFYHHVCLVHDFYVSIIVMLHDMSIGAVYQLEADPQCCHVCHCRIPTP